LFRSAITEISAMKFRGHANGCARDIDHSAHENVAL